MTELRKRRADGRHDGEEKELTQRRNSVSGLPTPHTHTPAPPSLQPEAAETVIVLMAETKDREMTGPAQGPPTGSRLQRPGPQVAQTASQSSSSCHMLGLAVSYLQNEGWTQFSDSFPFKRHTIKCETTIPRFC